MDKKKAALLLHDHRVNGMSYRILGKRYGISATTAHRMVKKANEEQPQHTALKAAAGEAAMPDDIKALKEALRIERLKTELLNAMIDISSKELGVDLRKKHGTRPSST